MIRKLKIRNAIGEEYDLTSRLLFFHSIEGLGFEDATQYLQIGDCYYPVEERFTQKEISGSLFFAEPFAYKRYREFTRFLRVTPLLFIYQTDETYKVPVRVRAMEKSELSSGKTGLNCQMVFAATGLFYKTLARVSEEGIGGGKIYSYTYPYQYTNVSQNTVLLESDSYVESPCKITIFGPCKDPVWKHYVNNMLVGSGAYRGELQEDTKLVIDTIKMPYSILEKDRSDRLVADRYQLCDFSTMRFFHLQHGNNRISVSHSGFLPLKVFVEGQISYETV